MNVLLAGITVVSTYNGNCVSLKRKMLTVHLVVLWHIMQYAAVH